MEQMPSVGCHPHIVGGTGPHGVGASVEVAIGPVNTNGVQGVSPIETRRRVMFKSRTSDPKIAPGTAANDTAMGAVYMRPGVAIPMPQVARIREHGTPYVVRR